MCKQKKLFSLSDEAVDKLKSLADKSGLSNSQVVEALIILANKENMKIHIHTKKEYSVTTEELCN